MRPENSDEIDIPPGGPPYTIFMGNLPDYALECDLEMMLKGLEVWKNFTVQFFCLKSELQS